MYSDYLLVWDGFLAEERQASTSAKAKIVRIRELTAEIVDMVRYYAETPASSLSDTDIEHAQSQFGRLTNELEDKLSELPGGRKVFRR